MTTIPRFHWWTNLALLVLGGLLALVFCGRRQSLTVKPRLPEDHGVLRVAYTPGLLPDPHRPLFPLSQYNELILSLWEPLVECDSLTNLPQPAAAQGWEWSPDQRTLTLHLRPDARWSNGDLVTAHDFVRGWQRLLRQDILLAQALFPLKNAEAYQQGRLKGIQSVGMHAVDDLTIRLELDHPCSTLVMELADPLLSPMHETSGEVLETAGYFDKPEALVTNGPFRLSQAGQDGFRLEPNRYYHSHAAIRLAGVQFVRAGRPFLAPLMLAAGVVDLLSPMPFGPAKPFPTARTVTLESELVLGVTCVDFNTSRAPLNDVRVRRALALALDRVAPIQKYDPGHMVPAWSWVPSMPGREGLALLKEDAAEARRLLAEAGYPDGRGFPVLRLAMPLWGEGDPFPMAISEHWFQELGVTVYLTYESPGKMNTRVATGDYDLLYGTLVATVPDASDLLSGFLQPLEYNTTKWINQEVVGLLNDANQRTGAERFAALEKAERALMAAVPSVPIMFERRQVMRGSEVHGWYVDALARQNLKRLWLEPGLADPTTTKPAL